MSMFDAEELGPQQGAVLEAGVLQVGKLVAGRCARRIYAGSMHVAEHASGSESTARACSSTCSISPYRYAYAANSSVRRTMRLVVPGAEMYPAITCELPRHPGSRASSESRTTSDR